MDDEQLNELALDAQQNPPGSQTRQIALTRLINGIIHSGRLIYPSGIGLSPDRYQDYRAEALQSLFYYICSSIDEYDIKLASVMRWANMLLERRFFREVSEQRVRNKKPVIFERFDEHLVSRSQWTENLGNESQFLSDLVRECLEDDVDGLFQECCLTKYPQVNFQKLVLRRLDGYQWQEISQEFSVHTSTLSGFYQASLRRLAPYIEASIRKTHSL